MSLHDAVADDSCSDRINKKLPDPSINSSFVDYVQDITLVAYIYHSQSLLGNEGLRFACQL